MSTTSEKKLDNVANVEVYRDEVESINQTSTSSHHESKIRKWLKWLEIDGMDGLSTKELFLYNYDLRPVESKRRTWRWYNYCTFWIADSFNINTWQIAATGVQAGLSWWVVWITVWLGYFFCGCFVTIAARVGTYYHISFPVAARSSFGIYGAIWPVFNRIVMACIWFGVQSEIGGNCVQLMLEAIFGQDLKDRIPDHVKGSLTSYRVLCFFLFWLFQLPFIWLHPHQVRHLFTVKAIICPIAGFTFLIWTLVKADGGGPVIHQGSTISGSEFGWAFVNSTMNSLANFATLIVNAPDFSRMAHNEKAAVWSQFISLPVCFSITCLIGILVSSAKVPEVVSSYCLLVLPLLN
ncbi:unnamed protein product [Ambrosiozyma monospora]|uniref:Unnamed protein product n=1 Tax=Ambrosiozyma monospora TaxID=43982 RepID=A0A9W6YQS5_AMBMO|nr:unnamed protein product [Ambrosiozyma monospora]